MLWSPFLFFQRARKKKGTITWAQVAWRCGPFNDHSRAAWGQTKSGKALSQCRGDTRPARGSKLTLLARTVDGYHPSSKAQASWPLDVLPCRRQEQGGEHIILIATLMAVKPARLHAFRSSTARALRDEASCPNFEPRAHARLAVLTTLIVDLERERDCLTVKIAGGRARRTNLFISSNLLSARSLVSHSLREHRRCCARRAMRAW